MTILLVICIGLFTGVMSGLLGIGGGVVMVPLLVFLLGVEQHMAQGISMLVIIPTSITAILSLHKAKLVNYRMAGFLAIGAVAGALISANLAQNIPSDALKQIFGFFVIISGIKMLFGKAKK